MSEIQDLKLSLRPAVPPKQETGTAWLPCPSVILRVWFAKRKNKDRDGVLPEGNQDP